jgi:protein-L-isoaspartate(D-aspartate) O-methyltransferase
VRDALAHVPRERFVPPQAQVKAYEDRPLPIGWGQTISQPYVVALMTELAHVGPGSRVLEIGTGSGYQTAVLAQLGADVWSIEIVEDLATSARERLAALGYDRVQTRIGDGYAGWPEQAPFDAIVLTAAPPRIPPPLLEQLAVGGRLVAPVGREAQELVVAARTEEGLRHEVVTLVAFVPMVGRADTDD